MFIVEIKETNEQSDVKKGELYLANEHGGGKIELLHKLTKKRKMIAEYEYNVKRITI